MDLFEQVEGLRNHLPSDGEVYYHGPVMGVEQADLYYSALLQQIPWQHDEAVIYGKRIVTRRQVAWYADQAFSYSYSGATRVALPWTQTLLALKDLVEQYSGERYNACLLNLYRDGSEGMAWHSDAERELKAHSAIASLSLGAARDFAFRHKLSKHKVSVLLEHGSLLIMQGKTQQCWQHSLPTTTRVSAPRINLTFRTMNPQ